MSDGTECHREKQSRGSPSMVGDGTSLCFPVMLFCLLWTTFPPLWPSCFLPATGDLAGDHNLAIFSLSHKTGDPPPGLLVLLLPWGYNCLSWYLLFSISHQKVSLYFLTFSINLCFSVEHPLCEDLSRESCWVGGDCPDLFSSFPFQ